MTSDASSHSRSAATFERKVRFSRWALLFERLWPRLWALLAVGLLFILVSLAGLWTQLGEAAHTVALGLFAVAAIAALVWIIRTPAPTRDQAIKRIERRSAVPHRPASSYEDKLTASASDPATSALWAAHRARLEALLARLKVGRPTPRADRLDPLALRALLLIGVSVFLVIVGDSAADRLRAAFRFGAAVPGVDVRFDAWITPPAYTGRPPVMLADGSRAPGEAQATPNDGIFEVPDRSVLIVRSTGPAARRLALQISREGAEPERLEPKASQDLVHAPAQAGSEVAEIKLELRDPGTVQVLGVAGIKPWHFKIIPDHPPKISLVKDPERMPRGALKLTYKVEDDYGVVSADVRITRAPPKPEDPALTWARPKVKGPRPPLERPPVLALRLPRANAKTAEASSYHELSGHPWAGVRVRLTLSAKDQAGQVGKSEPYEFILPQRHFSNPIAKAVIEQRRYLVEDPRNRPQVLRAIEAITYEPDGFFKDRAAYLGLRSAYWRLNRDKTRAGLKSVIDQLWHVAVRLEDGNLSDAERRLRQAQENLAKALEQGASDEEIRKLMQELRQALAEFMEQLAKQAEGQPPMEMPPGLAENQMIRPQDLERMMRDIENMARQGSRDMAQQMLSQLRDLLEQLQSGRMARMQGQQGQQMMQMMNELGDIIGKEQQLLDETFGEQRQDQEGQAGEQGQQGQQGQRGQQGQQGQRGQQRGGRGDELGRRQGELGRRLGQLRQGMQKFGMRSPQQFEGADAAADAAAVRQASRCAARSAGTPTAQRRPRSWDLGEGARRDRCATCARDPRGVAATSGRAIAASARARLHRASSAPVLKIASANASN
jgi:uncharacterized protein (TIGR02302 family)